LSEPRKAELRLIESEARIKACIDNSPELIAIKDIEGQYIYVNRAYCKHYKVTNEEVIGQQAISVHPEMDDNRIAEEESQVIETRAVRSYYETTEKNDETRFWITSRFPIITELDEVVGSGVMSRDITDLKIVEQELQQSEKRYRRLFETAPVSLWEQDWSGIKQLIDQLHEQGVADIRSYLTTNPDLIESIQASQLIDINSGRFCRSAGKPRRMC